MLEEARREKERRGDRGEGEEEGKGRGEVDGAHAEKQYDQIPVLAPSLRWSLKWAALAGAFFAGGVALTLSRQRPSTDRARTLEKRQQLIEELARLDDSFVGRPDDPHYVDRRDQLMREAVALTRVLEA